MKYIKFLLAITTLFFIEGCSFKVVKKPIVKYAIVNNTDIKRSDFSINKILKVDHFKSLKTLQSNQIWYQKPAYKTNSYVYSCWSSDFNLLIEKNISDALFKSHIFKSVFKGYSKIKADLLLEGDILKAIQSINDKGKVIFEIRLYLIDKRSGKLIGTKEFDYKKRCKSLNAKGAVNAYNQVVQNLDKDVVLWIKKLMKKN